MKKIMLGMLLLPFLWGCSNSNNDCTLNSLFRSIDDLDSPNILIHPTPTPEPTTLILLGCGIIGLALYRQTNAQL